MLNRIFPAVALLCALAPHALAMSTMDLPAGYPPPRSYLDGAALGLLAAAAFLIASRWLRSPASLRAVPWAVGTMLLLTVQCLADPRCDAPFLDGRRPVLVHPVPGAVELCNDGYVTLYDPAKRILVYSAEHVTTASLDAGEGMERANSFRPDPRLPREAQATDADFAHSGYDKGHMAPDHDMPTAEAKRQSDLFPNVVLQDPTLNRGLWSKIERAARGGAVGGLDAYIATGPILTPASGQAVAPPINGVPVPPRLFKAYHRPPDAKGHSFVGVWVARNEADARLEVWSLDRFIGEGGVDPFPALSAADHARADLPAIAAK